MAGIGQPRFLAVCAVSAGLGLVAAPAAARSQEQILGYDVDLRIESSGVVQVSERIDYDFGTAKRHGIYRDLPVRYRYDDRFDRLYRVTIVAVRGTPGTPADYTTENDGDRLRVRIADPDRTISGRHGYTIVYRVQGALNRFSDHDELYWNAVGTEWEIPIRHASAHVIAPARSVG